MEDKKIIEYNIPVQGQEQCDRHNKMLKEMFGDETTLIKPTEDHIDILFDIFNEAIQEVGDAGGWYVGDGIKVKIEIEYEPEDK